MKKKTKTVGKIIIPKEKILQATKPRYNAHQGATGAIGESKYKRKEKHRKDYKCEY